MRAIIGAALLLLAVAGCGGSASDERRLLLVLLTDNQLLRVSADGEVLTRTRLGRAPASSSYGGLLAAGPDRRTVYALVRGKRQQIAAIDHDGGARERYDLPRGVTWRRLGVGSRSGRLYVAGNVAGSRRNELGHVELSVRLLVLSPDGEALAHERIRAARGHDWYVTWLTVAEDESTVLVGYHGSDTTGSDLVQLDPIRACRDRTPAWGACLARNHGRAEWIDDGILAATGERALAVLDANGRVLRELDTGLRGVHLMEFALAGDVAYAFGNCIQGAGVVRVSLARGGSQTIVEDACGETGALVDDSTLALGRRRDPDPSVRDGDAALVFVDLERRRVERSVRLPEDPADVLSLD